MDYEHILGVIETEINQLSGERWFYLDQKPERREARAYFKAICCDAALHLLKAYDEVLKAQAEDY